MLLNRHVMLLTKLDYLHFLGVVFSSKVAENHFLLFYGIWESKVLNFLVTLNGVRDLIVHYFAKKSTLHTWTRLDWTLTIAPYCAKFLTGQCLEFVERWNCHPSNINPRIFLNKKSSIALGTCLTRIVVSSLILGQS